MSRAISGIASEVQCHSVLKSIADSCTQLESIYFFNTEHMYHLMSVSQLQLILTLNPELNITQLGNFSIP
jgi:hypothetical protein